MKIVWASVALLALMSSAAKGAIVYQTAGDNVDLYDQIAGEDYLSYGDQVNLAGTARQITSITIPFMLPDFPEDGFPANSNYTPDLTLTLYKDDGTVTSTSDTITNGFEPPLGGYTRPSTVIASSEVVGPTFVPEDDGFDEQTITFTFNDVVVPSTFSFLATQNNITPGSDENPDITSIDNFSMDLTEPNSHPQIVGSNNGFVWVQDSVTGLFEATDFGFGLGTVGVQATIVAVPEPSTLLLAAAGLAACALVRRTKSRRR